MRPKAQPIFAQVKAEYRSKDGMRWALNDASGGRANSDGRPKSAMRVQPHFMVGSASRDQQARQIAMDHQRHTSSRLCSCIPDEVFIVHLDDFWLNLIPPRVRKV